MISKKPLINLCYNIYVRNKNPISRYLFKNMLLLDKFERSVFLWMDLKNQF